MPRAPRNKKSLPHTPTENVVTSSRVNDPARVRALWLSVSAVMILIIAGWVSLIRFNGFSAFTNGSNPFRSFYEQVKGVFTNEKESTTASAVTTQAADESKLRSLREQVFPQFRDLPTEQP